MAIKLLILILLVNYFNKFFAQSFHKRDNGNEIYEIRIYESAPPGTKATLNEPFDRLMREQKNCFAQLETGAELDWIEFDPTLLIFVTTIDVPTSARATQQAILHLMCSANKMRSIHFSVHVTRRNRHPPKFSMDNYRFYAPISMSIGSELGHLIVVDHDPIIYNSQIQLSILPFEDSNGKPSISNSQLTQQQQQRFGGLNHQTVIENAVNYWQIYRNGSIIVQKSMTNLRIYVEYRIRILAVDFGSPQLFSIANVTILPVSVSQPSNVRVNIANIEYQIFEWDPPAFGVAEKYRLTIRRRNDQIILHEQDIPATESIVLSKMNFPTDSEYSAIITAVDVDGESPSLPHIFQLVNTELNCNGECSPKGGVPMCYYGGFNKIEQYRDLNGLHCLCFDGFSSAQCDNIETCPSERSIESYGGVDWPLIKVNKSSAILCPYNANGELLHRKCVWDSRLNLAKWENVSNNEVCKKQSSILVHLGVLANYAQRADQTSAGLRAVQRFLNTVLLFPAFNPRAISAHFDSKIAEHVAHVIDTVAQMNLTYLTNTTNMANNGNNLAINGNFSEDIRLQLIDYIREFARRLPTPFLLESSAGGLQFKTWNWPWQKNDDEENDGNLNINNNNNNGNIRKIRDNDEEFEYPNQNIEEIIPINFNYGSSVELNHRCYIHLPKLKNKANGDLKVRIACLKTATLFANLDGKAPILFVEASDKEDFNNNENDEKILKENSQNFEKILKKRSLVKVLPEQIKVLIALKPISTDGIHQNYTCAYYDDQIVNGWSITGIRVLSRNFENGFVLCETTHLSVFALLPETMFIKKESNFLRILSIILPIATNFIIILSTFFLFLIALFHSLQMFSSIDPAQVFCLFNILLIHLIHLFILIIPHFQPPLEQSNNLNGIASFIQFFDNKKIYLFIEFLLLSIAALVVLLNSVIHSRVVDLELERRRLYSFCERLSTVLFFGLVLPFALCFITWYFNGYIIFGLTTKTPTLQPFNWIFGICFLFPLVVLIGCAMGYGGYSFYYANTLSHSTPIGCRVISLTSHEQDIKARLLRNLANVAVCSFLFLLFFYSEALLVYQKYSILRNIVLAILHLGLTLTIFMFSGNLLRIELKSPRYAASNASMIGVQRYGTAFRDDDDYGSGDDGNGRIQEKLPTKQLSNGDTKSNFEKPSIRNGGLNNGNVHHASLIIPSRNCDATIEESDSGLDKKFLLATSNNNNSYCKNNNNNKIVIQKPKILNDDYGTLKQTKIKNYSSNLQQQQYGVDVNNYGSTLQTHNLPRRSLIPSTTGNKSPIVAGACLSPANNTNTRSFFLPSGETESHATFRRSSQPLISSTTNINNFNSILTPFNTNPIDFMNNSAYITRNNNDNSKNGTFASRNSTAARYAFLYGNNTPIGGSNGGGTSDGTVSTTATTTTSPEIRSGHSSGEATPPATTTTGTFVPFRTNTTTIRAAPPSPARTAIQISKVEAEEEEANNKDKRYSESYTSEDFREEIPNNKINSNNNNVDQLGHPLVSVV